MEILGRNRLPQLLMADFCHAKLSDLCLNFKLRCIYEPHYNNSFLHFMKTKLEQIDQREFLRTPQS